MRPQGRSLLLMIVEDVHWGDPTSLELIELVIQRTDQLPILLLITFRPEFVAPWSGQAHVTSVTLRRLDRRESAELVRGAVGGDALTADVVDQVAERGDGIPLFLEELSSALVESGADASAVFAGDAARSAPVIPVTLQASLRNNSTGSVHLPRTRRSRSGHWAGVLL